MIELLQGDCMEYMKTLKDNEFDLAIVDPPYGIETRGNAQDRFRGGMQLSTVNDAKPTPEYFIELFRVSANQIIWGYNWLSDMLPKCREFIFWYKHQPVITFADGELAWTSFKSPVRKFAFLWAGCMREKNSYGKEVRIHPTHKPIDLYRWTLKTYAKEGDTILDTHLGSGSSRIAAHDMGFDFTGYEIDKDYYEASEQRFQNHIQQGTIFSPKEMY